LVQETAVLAVKVDRQSLLQRKVELFYLWLLVERLEVMALVQMLGAEAPVGVAFMAVLNRVELSNGVITGILEAPHRDQMPVVEEALELQQVD
jgi:hypothetical protein